MLYSGWEGRDSYTVEVENLSYCTANAVHVSMCACCLLHFLTANAVKEFVLS